MFFHTNDANYIMKPGRVLPHSLSSSVKASWPARDWSRLVRQLATHAQLLLTGSGAESRTDLFADGMSGEQLSQLITAFCYRYYNGMPGQVSNLRF